MRYTLRVAPDADRDVIARVMGFYADACPVARSIRGSIAITDEIDIVTD